MTTYDKIPFSLISGQDVSTGGEDFVDTVAVADDGSTVIAGSTLGNWNATVLGGKDFAACKLDVNGALLWKWQVTYTKELIHISR